MSDVDPGYLNEYEIALRSCRAAKNIFWILLGIMLLLLIATFVAVQFFNVLDVTPAAQSQLSVQPAAGDQGQATSQFAFTPQRRAQLADAMRWVLSVSKYDAMILAGLLSLTLLMTTQLSLLGRLGGTAGFIGAFFWSLVLLVLVVPWQSFVIGGPIGGAMYELDSLLTARGVFKSSTDLAWIGYAHFYGRFFAYPIIVLLVWLTVQVRFARGHRLASVGETEPLE